MEGVQDNKPDKVSWFEFLLKEDLLEEHLAKSNPDPPAADLIGVFLQKAEVAVNTARDIAEKEYLQNDLNSEKDSGIEIKPLPLPVDSKKAHALRLLAIKAVAFLRWDLSILEKSVPLPVSHEVLKELVGITTPLEQTKTPHAQLQLDMIPDHMFFALQLYYRWWVRSVVKEGFCSRPSKVVNVQVPGLLDTSVITAASRESITKMIHDGIVEATKMLEQLLDASRAVIMPTIKSFGMLNENTNTVTHDWYMGVPLSAEELRLLICYDFACVNFMQGNVEKAGRYFQETQQLVNKIGQSDLVQVDEARLRGYCAACGVGDGSSPKLYARIEATRHQHFEGVVGLLQEDNEQQELNLQYRLSLEDDIRTLRHPCTIIFRVTACNVVRRLQQGQTASADFLHQLKVAPQESTLFFLKVCEDALKVGSYKQKAGVKNFLRYLGQMLPDNKLIQEQLSDYFSLEEWEELGRLQTQSQHKYLNTKATSKSPDPQVKQGELKKRLRASYDTAEIRLLITQLMEKMDRHSIVSLADKWFLPHDMSNNLANVSGLDGTYAHILIAKAKICSDLKLYDKVRELLYKADPLVKDTSYNLSRLIRWEILLVDLLQYQQHGTCAGGQTLKDLAKKSKTCITSLNIAQDLRPRYEVVANCAVFLLTTKDWEFLVGLADINNGALQLTCLMAALCKELPLIKGARKAGRILWEAVNMIFTNKPQQQKRSSSGVATVVQRNPGMGMMAQEDFIQYICLLQDTVALSAMISCLTKLFNLVKDDISCEISSDYILLWPTALGSTSLLNVAAVSEAVKTIMVHALKVDPVNPSWVRTQADIHFGHSQHVQALKYYLEAGAVATDFFTEPVPKNIFDDTVYKRMIKCCSYLQCQHQVAVLCQFLDEVDYTTAFKAVQDRNSHDATDAYYDYFWDISMLEFLINLHTRRGEHEKKQMALRVIGQLELNASNPTEILNEASKLRKTRFLRALAKQYL